MRYKLIILFCLLNLNVAFCAQTVAKASQSSFDIFQTVENLWSAREFKELDKYIKELEQLWKGYVPVEIALAIYSYQYGAQVEDSIEKLKMVREKLNIEMASPIFMSLLDSRILRYEKLQQFYKKMGYREKND